MPTLDVCLVPSYQFPLSTGRWKWSVGVHVNILFCLLSLFFFFVTLPPDQKRSQYSAPLVPRREKTRDDANARFNLPSFRVEGPSPDKSDKDGERHHSTVLSESGSVSPVRFASVGSDSGRNVAGDIDMSPPYRSRLAERRDRDQTMPLGAKRRGSGCDSVGGSRGRYFGGTLSRAQAAFLEGGVDKRVSIGDVYWTGGQRRDDVDVDDGKKPMVDDPAAVPRRQGARSDMEDWDGGRTGYRQGAWRKLGRFCLERVYNTFNFSWRYHVSRGAPVTARMDPNAERGIEFGSASGPGVRAEGLTRTRRRASAPLVGATAGRVPIKATQKTITIGADTGPEQSYQSPERFSNLIRPRPTSVPAWVTGPISTSTTQVDKRTQMQTRSNGRSRLVKRRPKSVTTAG